MLQHLSIQNYALIQSVEMQFDAGLNIITGETGAGKSIVIGALGLALGNRADSNVLSSSQSKCVVEASFSIQQKNLRPFFEKHDLDYDDATIVRREILSNGKSRAFINDTPVKLKLLSEFGQELMEIHSQRDNLQLFRKDFQFLYLDTLSSTMEARKSYFNNYQSWKEKSQLLEELISQEQEARKQLDYNTFLFEELYNAKLNTDEEAKLEREQELLENAEELLRLFGNAEYVLNESDQAIIQQLKALSKSLSSIKGPVLDGIVQRLESAIIEISDIGDEINNLAQETEVNSERLELINDRLALIFSLKNKHGVDSVEALVKIQNELDDQLNENTELGQAIEKLKLEISKMNHQLQEQASALHEARMKAATGLEESINHDLKELGMIHSQLKLSLSKRQDFNEYGLTELEIVLSSDKGKTFIPIKQSASGGEMSRINLAFKRRMSVSSELISAVFDEIDTGVSGEVARKVGQAMREISENQQVIAITHLAQIASLGSKHFYIFKEDKDGDVQTNVKVLEKEDRIHEVAKMISGQNLTESAIEQSKELLKG